MYSLGNATNLHVQRRTQWNGQGRTQPSCALREPGAIELAILLAIRILISVSASAGLGRA